MGTPFLEGIKLFLTGSLHSSHGVFYKEPWPGPYSSLNRFDCFCSCFNGNLMACSHIDVHHGGKCLKGSSLEQSRHRHHVSLHFSFYG